MIALYVLLGIFALLTYGGMCGLTFTVVEWLWPSATKADSVGVGFACVVWWLTLPVVATAAAAIWVASHLASWRAARSFPKAQVFRG